MRAGVAIRLGDATVTPSGKLMSSQLLATSRSRTGSEQDQSRIRPGSERTRDSHIQRRWPHSEKMATFKDGTIEIENVTSDAHIHGLRRDTTDWCSLPEH